MAVSSAKLIILPVVFKMCSPFKCKEFLYNILSSYAAKHPTAVHDKGVKSEDTKVH